MNKISFGNCKSIISPVVVETLLNQPCLKKLNIIGIFKDKIIDSNDTIFTNIESLKILYSYKESITLDDFNNFCKRCPNLKKSVFKKYEYEHKV